MLDMKMRSALIVFGSLMLATPLLAACDDDGPAEELGEKIDDGAEDAGDAIDDAVN